MQATASVPKKTVSLKGCTSRDCAQSCAQLELRTIANGSTMANAKIVWTVAGIQPDSKPSQIVGGGLLTTDKGEDRWFKFTQAHHGSPSFMR